jgi:hypothetical protein
VTHHLITRLITHQQITHHQVPWRPDPTLVHLVHMMRGGCIVQDTTQKLLLVLSRTLSPSQLLRHEHISKHTVCLSQQLISV